MGVGRTGNVARERRFSARLTDDRWPFRGLLNIIYLGCNHQRFSVSSSRLRIVTSSHLRRPIFFVGGNGTVEKTTNTFTEPDDPDPVPVFGSSNTPLNS
jgi:hypothetical protein